MGVFEDGHQKGSGERRVERGPDAAEVPNRPAAEGQEGDAEKERVVEEEDGQKDGDKKEDDAQKERIRKKERVEEEDGLWQKEDGLQEEDQLQEEIPKVNQERTHRIREDGVHPVTISI